MGAVTRFAAAVGFAGAAVALCAFPVHAGCKRMAFSVNDYGKDGPTKDSQELLDKHIATWAGEQGIEKYTVGKKDVTCELFLNLIVVDEHTCTARATVCWGGDKPPGTQEAKKKDAEKTAAKADAAEEKKAEQAAAKPAEPKDAKPAEAKAAEASPPATGSPSAESAPATTPAAAQVETGALPLTNKPADTAEKPADDSFSVSERDAVAAAAAAAERAAAAAERAAAAAERAAASVAEQIANAAKAQAATASNATAEPTAPEPPAFGAPSQPVVAPIQPDPSASKP